MTRPPSRPATWLAGVAAMLPLAALAAPAGASSVSGSIPGTATMPETAFTPPARPLLLTRVLHSPLADGKEVVARRTYRIEILPDGQGFRVEGALVDSAIEAPPALDALAEIERTRPDTGLFPMRLDERGVIVPGSPAASPAADDTLARAATVAVAMIQRAPLAAVEQQEAQAFVRKLQAQPVSTPWPETLFHLAPGHHVDNRQLDLPGGASGTVRVETMARIGGDEGVVSSLERTVTTEIGTGRRTTREEWLLRIAS